MTVLPSAFPTGSGREARGRESPWNTPIALVRIGSGGVLGKQLGSREFKPNRPKGPALLDPFPVCGPSELATLLFFICRTQPEENKQNAAPPRAVSCQSALPSTRVPRLNSHTTAPPHNRAGPVVFILCEPVGRKRVGTAYTRAASVSVWFMLVHACQMKATRTEYRRGTSYQIRGLIIRVQTLFTTMA